jgi:hypothetical protein
VDLLPRSPHVLFIFKAANKDVYIEKSGAESRVRWFIRVYMSS